MALAEAVGGAEPNSDATSLATGAALFRSGRFAEAADRLAAAAASSGQADGESSGRSVACASYLLAMAHHRLGHSTQARDCLRRAGKCAAAELRSKPPWGQRLAIRLLARQPEAQVGAGAHEHTPD